MSKPRTFQEYAGQHARQVRIDDTHLQLELCARAFLAADYDEALLHCGYAKDLLTTLAQPSEGEA